MPGQLPGRSRPVIQPRAIREKTAAAMSVAGDGDVQSLGDRIVPAFRCASHSGVAVIPNSDGGHVEGNALVQ
jgi:hypothetical protein